MRFVDIMEFPINEYADKDCCLFLWATSAMLPEALLVMKYWKFDFKCVAFTWVKKNKNSDSWFWGMGSWTRSNPEFCLLGIRGNPERVCKDVHSVIDSKIREHSRKPDEIRQRIVKLCGDLPRVELFARHRFEGWDVYGNEIEPLIQTSLSSMTLQKEGKLE